jgi:hypothetical protein
MALTDSEGMGTTMLVQPTGTGGGFGDMGGNGWWIILLFILLGGWNNGYGGNYGGGASEIQTGFNQSALVNGINGLTAQVGNGFSEVQQSLCNGFSQAEISNNARQMANMQTAFGMQTAITQGMNDLAMGLQNCCCENRSNIADLKYTVATENCADRYEAAQNTRDIIDSQTRGTQAILDKLCALELDGYKRENDNLRTQLNMATLRESQTAQNSLITQGFANEVDALYNRLNSCPVPTTPVYGRTPIFTCNQNTGCGCGCA